MDEIKRLTESLFNDLTIEKFGNVKYMSADEVYNKAVTLRLRATTNNSSKEEVKNIIGRFQENLCVKGSVI